MTSVWVYPWAHTDPGVNDDLDRLADLGVDAVAVAGHYHSIQTLLPRHREDGGVFHSYPGGCHFVPDPAHFEETPIDPVVNTPGTDQGGDSFGAVVEWAGDHDVDARAWTVCLHNSRLGADHPTYRIQSAFGDEHDHALCPSWPAVRAYFAGIAKSLRDYGVDGIDLESIGFPNVFHGHGHRFNHLKNHTVTCQAGQFLISQCFCSGCRAAAADHHVEFDAAEALVQELARDVLRDSTTTPPSFADLTDRYDEFRALMDFRATVVERLVRSIAAASGDVPVNYYVADGFGRNADDGWPAGVRLDRLQESLDAVTAICYTADPAVASARLRSIRDRFEGPVHGGVTLDPAVVGTEAAFREVVDTVRRDGTGELGVYNHSLLGADQLGWLERVL